MRWIAVLVLPAVLLLAAACGDEGGTGETEPPTATTDAEPTSDMGETATPIETQPPAATETGVPADAPTDVPATATSVPPPAPTNAPVVENCDRQSYPDVCIPTFPPDLNCGDILFRRFTVLPPDPHGFDRDNDGIGCESG